MTNQEKAEAIIKIVCDDFNLHRADLIGKKRLREYVMARHFSMFYIRKYTNLSLNQVGKMFLKDHATVMHAVINAQDLIQWNGCKVIDDRLTKAITKELFGNQLAAVNRAKRRSYHYRAMRRKASMLFKKLNVI